MGQLAVAGRTPLAIFPAFSGVARAVDDWVLIRLTEQMSSGGITIYGFAPFHS